MPKIAKSAQTRMSAQEKRWEAESALNTLMRAKQIQDDKGLHSRAMKIAAEQHKVLTAVVKKPPAAFVKKK